MDTFWRRLRVGCFVGAWNSLTFFGAGYLCLKLDEAVRHLPHRRDPDAIDYLFLLPAAVLGLIVTVWAKRWGDRNIEPLQYRGSQYENPCVRDSGGPH